MKTYVVLYTENDNYFTSLDLDMLPWKLQPTLAIRITNPRMRIAYGFCSDLATEGPLLSDDVRILAPELFVANVRRIDVCTPEAVKAWLLPPRTPKESRAALEAEREARRQANET